jgi:Na+-translocating ferredoxin:NAD+ oxidoreductase RnfD subunit
MRRQTAVLTKELMHTGHEILITVVMKSFIFWDIMPNSPFCYLFHAGFLLGLFFNPEV